MAAEIKISEMTEAVTLTDEDLVPIVQSNLNKKIVAGKFRQYKDLHEKPLINGVVLENNKNLKDLKLIKAESGIETDSTDNTLKLEEITENDIKTRNSVKGNRAVSLNKIDITASNTAHQDMSDSYNANTNPLLIQGEKQPVSYKATKNYIDTKNQEIMQHIVDEKIELIDYINEEDLKVKEHVNTLNQNTDNKFTELTNVLREDVDTLITDVDNIEQTILKDREENQEKFFTGKISIPMDPYSGPTSIYGVNVEKIEGNYKQEILDNTPKKLECVRISEFNSHNNIDTINNVDNIENSFNLETIILPKPLILRALPNGIKDIYENGVITRRIGEVIFDGGDNVDWYIVKEDNNYMMLSTSVISAKTFVNAISNRLKSLGNIIPEILSAEGFIEYNNYNLRIIFSKSKASTIAEFKTYLSNNPIIFYYELETPINEQFSIPTLPSFHPFSVINHNSIIKPEQIIWAINTKINASYLKNEVYNKEEIDLQMSDVIKSGDIMPIGTNLRVDSDTPLPPGFELIDETYEAQEVYMSDGSTVEYNINYLKESGLQVADPIPVGAGILYEGEKSKIPPNFELRQVPFSNPNIIINPSFKINQRELTTYTVGRVWTYTIDRWMTIGCTVIVENDGVTITNKEDVNNWFLQKIENTLVGNYTASIFVENITGIINFKFGENYILLKKGLNIINMSNVTLNEFIFNITGNSSIKIKWVKLEFGSVATTFIPRSYGEEFILCSRYYQKNIRVCGLPYSRATTSKQYFWIYGAFSIEMRTMPTVIIKTAYISNIGAININVIEPLTINEKSIYGNVGITTNVDMGATSLPNYPLLLTCNVDAELY